MAFIAIAVAVQVAAPEVWPAAMVITPRAATASFSGGLVTRAAGRYDEALLPAVAILTGDDKLAPDAGCGAGRTTLALGRAFKRARIVALDRFDSDYIEEGGRLLFERGAARWLASRVRIESGDLTAMPFADGSFDAVVSAHAIDHLGPQKEHGAARSVKSTSGGRLLLIVWVPGWAMFSLPCWYFRRQNKFGGEWPATSALSSTTKAPFNGSDFLLLQKPLG